MKTIFFLGLIFYFSLPVNSYAISTQQQLKLGERLYRQGISTSGKPILAKQSDSIILTGADAACVKCHRRSGMGGVEGNVIVPPITGRFLFASTQNNPLALLDTRTPKAITHAHPSYTTKTLTRAINQGIDYAQKQLNPLMPRYQLSKQDNQALIAYLKQLSSSVSPGVTQDSINFATIITPEISGELRASFTKMMHAVVNQRNASQEYMPGRMRMALDLIPRTPRAWKLRIWELQGAPETWAEQLATYYRQDPVFAIVSGLSESTWEPIDHFCNTQHIPCLLPSTPVTTNDPQFYSLYFSQGVVLEAQVIARYLRDLGDKAPRKVIQVYRDDTVGQAASEALKTALQNSAIRVESIAITQAAQLADVIGTADKQDAVVLWLPSSEIAATNTISPKALTFASGYLLHEQFKVFPASWRAQLRIVYPYELGQKRQQQLQQLNSWSNTWQLPLIDEARQADAFFNMLLLTDLTTQMLDNLQRDYMVERAEDMLSNGTNSSAYPHLSLAPKQRFASKGAYIAKFDANGVLVPETDWLIP